MHRRSFSGCSIHIRFQVNISNEKCNCYIKNEEASKIGFIAFIHFENVHRNWQRSWNRAPAAQMNLLADDVRWLRFKPCQSS